eukprot:scaffold506579_cov45-Prasinocladus_malaysianus.AAC.1
MALRAGMRTAYRLGCGSPALFREATKAATVLRGSSGNVGVAGACLAGSRGFAAAAEADAERKT